MSSAEEAMEDEVAQKEKETFFKKNENSLTKTENTTEKKNANNHDEANDDNQQIKEDGTPDDSKTELLEQNEKFDVDNKVEKENIVPNVETEKVKIVPKTGDGRSTKEENIDKLLDSALKDFDRKKPSKKSKTKNKQQAKSPEDDLLEMFGKAGFPESASLQDLNNQLLNISLLGQQHTTHATETSFGSSSFPGPSSASANQGSAELGADDMKAAASLQEALLQLSKDSEKLQELPTEEEMEKMFSGMSTDNLEKDLGNLLPMMEGMMQSLLSKELLYPAMKDMHSQFPAWLENNKGKLSTEDMDKYTRQYNITARICAEFEKEAETTQEGKKHSFDSILALMEEMQGLGHPPKDLVGDTALPSLPGAGQEQCTIS